MDGMEKQRAVGLLFSEGASCVILSGGEMHIFRQRGVKDLFELLEERPVLLHGAFIADKVVGKGAAALMILGGVEEVYADVISEAALALFEASEVKVSSGRSVAYIINRAGTGMCPVESLCQECATAAECLPLIRQFIEQQQKK